MGIRRRVSNLVNWTKGTVKEGKENLSPSKLGMWLDSRVGFTNSMLKPAPSYSLNPFYWLGALAFLAFVLNVITGTLMLLYYIPTPTQAYPSTMNIVQNVPFGGLLETIHLYGAYAMILLIFLHLMRGYFVSVHKKPRELMWVTGMLMGVVTLAMGLTGYLLPWTVLSKSATDVSVGFISLMPPVLANIVNYLVAGTGTNSTELTRFFDLHIIILPMVLILLFAAKMYMFETHGASEPTSGIKSEVKYHPWFPNVILYLTMIGGVFVSLLLAASVIVPYKFPPEYSVATASHYIARPDWYFIALYQLLKLKIFEGNNEIYGVTLGTLALILLIILPFVDRNKRKDPRVRPVFTALGAIFIVEVVFLTVWGYLTPGQVINTPDAVAGLAGPPLVTAGVWWLIWRVRGRPETPATRQASSTGGLMQAMKTPFRVPALTGTFVVLLLVGSVAFSTLVGGFGSFGAEPLTPVLSLVVLLVSFAAMTAIVKRLVRMSEAGKPR